MVGNCVFILTVVILNLCEPEPTESQRILSFVFQSEGRSAGSSLVVGHAPLLACSVVCVKGLGLFTGL